LGLYALLGGTILHFVAAERTSAIE